MWTGWDKSAERTAVLTRSRSMPADAEAVFDIVSDLENMTTWLPGSVEIELSSPNRIRVWLPGRHAEFGLERRVWIDWDRLRVKWGSESTTACSGTLQVLRLADDRSAVTVQLIGPPGASAIHVNTWVESALDALETVIATECGITQQVSRTAG
ncbi:SRPBCC family protein [Lentzea alba]|uniref:SRPBCC family protein n=1 Tax=Lentzea alba TaxID=2714351 RepID=UPI0039BF8F63